MVFGTSLRISGEFINPKPLPTVAFQAFVTKLRRLFSLKAAQAALLWPSPSCRENKRPRSLFRRKSEVKTLSTNQLKPAYIAPGDLAHLTAASSKGHRVAQQPSTTDQYSPPMTRASTSNQTSSARREPEPHPEPAPSPRPKMPSSGLRRSESTFRSLRLQPRSVDGVGGTVEPQFSCLLLDLLCSYVTSSVSACLCSTQHIHILYACPHE